jgi:ribose-phosphate pyrophosphokinase
MMDEEIRLFALHSSRNFGEKVGKALGIPLSAHEEREFEDGEHKARLLENVREKDVFVIHSLYSDARQSVNDKLCRLLFFLGALRDASAGRITAVIPYLCYARKDRKTKSRDPITTRYVAALMEGVGVDRVVTMDVHNLAAYQNAFRCHTDHLEARKLFVNHFTRLLAREEIVVVSPDVGGTKRAMQLRDTLSQTLNKAISTAFMEKQRSGGVVSGETIIGDIEDRHAIIIDDLIGSGTTISRAVKACRAMGAKTIYAAATHGLFVGAANDVVAQPDLNRVVVTDSVPPFRLRPEIATNKLVVLDSASFIGAAIERIHSGGSIVELLETWPG